MAKISKKNFYNYKKSRIFALDFKEEIRSLSSVG